MRIGEGLVGSKDWTSGDELKKNNAEAVDIAERSQVEGRAISRVQVARRAFDLAAHVRPVADGPRSHQPEVTNLRFHSISDQDIAWLYVPVDYASLRPFV